MIFKNIESVSHLCTRKEICIPFSAKERTRVHYDVLFFFILVPITQYIALFTTENGYTLIFATIRLYVQVVCLNFVCRENRFLQTP